MNQLLNNSTEATGVASDEKDGAAAVATSILTMGWSASGRAGNPLPRVRM
ncbi:MAG: hypothetical protein H6668_08405 [Ardenticatenaceae bacterium]|nr:hypothetical protein [Ardenticatenaceae bacterium]